eukprot:gnl/TRDRNA2_/TRDRNA2_82506_c0_seq1.p1 gnl/TRDRNA2_/TRDRNA2_82506_c0~~gnl/TRDRNA2_/TRDRNA2_82506_c0_seq1.p1  ORF type:complete len:338 (+),score=76.60 gnl/TRDRNA2_/TRDRNA2_82506_c0_seq1:48-1016(+)
MENRRSSQAARRPSRPPPWTPEELGERLELLQRRTDTLEATVLGVGAGAGGGGSPLGGVEAVRLRNELGLGVQELNDQLADRLAELRTWQQELRAELLSASSEALQTCNRLADDSLAVSEATQRKLRDLSEWAEAQVGRIECDLLTLRLNMQAPGSGNDQEPALPADGRPIPGRPARELEGQMQHLGDALRRVVQVQREQQQELLVLQQVLQHRQQEKKEEKHEEGTTSAGPLPPPDPATRRQQGSNSRGPARYADIHNKASAGRCAATAPRCITELFQELQRLENGTVCCAQPPTPARRLSPRPRRLGSRQPDRRRLVSCH